MLTQHAIDELRLKILPNGGERIIKLLALHTKQVVLSTIAMEGVPLIILARHGILARLPFEGTLQKLSAEAAITEALHRFFTGSDTLYLYVNLPDLPVPDCVADVMDEAAQNVQVYYELRQRINDALDAGDKERFMRLTAELKAKERIGERIRFDVR